MRRPGRRVGGEATGQGRNTPKQTGDPRVAAPREAVRYGKSGGVYAGASSKLGGELLEAAIGDPASGIGRANDSGEIRINRRCPRQRSPLHPFVEPIEIALGRLV